tara:strand:+ start:1277 stop:1618 length:342 start_codon:yes stop_codon:yes gene_type:complete
MSNPFSIEWGIACPLCVRRKPADEDFTVVPGDNNLHQKTYRIWPTHEDDLSGKCVTIRDEHKELWVDTETKDSDNPSPRGRGAIAVEFWCEQCGSDLTFLILQHKGSTFMGWK